MDPESPQQKSEESTEKAEEKPATAAPTEAQRLRSLAEKKAQVRDLPSPGHGVTVRGSRSFGGDFT